MNEEHEYAQGEVIIDIAAGETINLKYLQGVLDTKFGRNTYEVEDFNEDYIYTGDFKIKVPEGNEDFACDQIKSINKGYNVIRRNLTEERRLDQIRDVFQVESIYDILSDAAALEGVAKYNATIDEIVSILEGLKERSPNKRGKSSL
ncbi:hypothetical protein GOV11_05350 [Candidatus Woesearchaeota archaeon]|nr:hypothetical protein [Candidatus Woesearchaeota archaeon]